MHGVFLHVLADTLGSVGVIISTCLIQRYDLRIADPICAFIISILILMSVFPLVSHSSRVLIHQAPASKQLQWTSLQQTICGLNGVVGVADCHLFSYTGEQNVCSLRVGVKKDNEEEVLHTVEELLNEMGLTEHTVQVEVAENSNEFMELKNEPSSLVHHHDHSHDHVTEEQPISVIPMKRDTLNSRQRLSLDRHAGESTLRHSLPRESKLLISRGKLD